MNTLSSLLNDFAPAKTVVELTEQFAEIADSALNNGYLLINENYKIYLLDIEFYFHTEKENCIKDPQMYHCGNMPFFLKGSLCPNRSGVDVTFEDYKNHEYRASFLIRGYKYVDDTETYVNNEKKEDYNPQYLWEDLFGNAACIGSGKGLNIKWVDELNAKYFKPISGKRANVDIITGETEHRLWRFSRN